MRKIFSILFALVLALSFSLVAVPAVEANGVTPDRVTLITNAADRLVDLQNDDGGFPWDAPGDGTSYTNLLGITAMGILKAWELDAKAEYETALAKAYDYCVDKPPTYTNVGGKWKETTKGVDSFPDIAFLVWFSQAAAGDASLLAEINALQDPDITAADIASLAKERWDTRVNHLGATPPSEVGTATALAQCIRDDRHGQDYDALIPWDLETGVKAAQVLDGYYPGDGYDQQAIDIAEVIYNSIDDAGDVYFDSTNTTQEDYIAGLTGGIEAFREVALHLDKAAELVTLLLAKQQAGGYWDYYGATPATMSVQSTAYAVMALQGYDAEAVTATWKAAAWLAASQKGDGGWFSEEGAGDEYAEIDSEAAWTLARLPAPVTVDTKGYYSIQDAIDAANPGDTINVAAGTYQESLGGWRDIQIFKSLSIIGAGSELTVVELSGLQHGIEIHPDTSGVLLIQGMTFTKRTSNTKSADWAIIVGETGGTFNSLTFRDVEVAWGQARNLHLCDATYHSIVLENCNIHDGGTWGFSARGTIDSMTVEDSHFDHNGSWGGDKDHGIGFDIDMPVSVGSLDVTGGTFNNNTAKGINLVKTSNATFTDITANNNGGAPGGGFGVCLWEWDGTSEDLTFNNPMLIDNATDGFLIGCETGMTVRNLAITCGTMTGNGRAGLFVYRASDWGEGVIEDVVITQSSITGNGQWGVAAIMAYEDIDARHNWWGSSSGPYHTTLNPGGTGDAVSDNVTFEPWLVGFPTVTTQAATSITTNSTTLNMNYTVSDFSLVEVRFAYKKSANTEWSYTDWVSKEADGTHAEVLTGLNASTKYDFKAQLKYNDTEIEGDSLQFTTKTSSTLPPSQGCFIATAAYGTPTAEQIDVLREFRDVVLLKNTVGSQFVALYYQFSPPVADFIAENSFLRTLVRELLIDPIVWVVEATGDIWQD
jgi:hypothetical protein